MNTHNEATVRRLVALVLLCAVLVSLPLGVVADERDKLKVGLQPDGRIVVPTNQILQPAGGPSICS